jgi:photosystem II stability/assembly factor-like uncharacterized protein
MGNIGDEIVTLAHTRTWIQWGGARPNNPPKLSGVGAQYLMIAGLSMPTRGGIDAIRVHDPKTIGRYRLIGMSESPPDFDAFTMTQRKKKGAVSKILQRRACPINIYVHSGDCVSMGAFQSGWTNAVMVMAHALSTTNDAGDQSSFDGTEPIEVSTDMVAIGGAYEFGSMSFAEGGATVVEYEVIDACFGTMEQCGNCGPDNPGTAWRYAVTTFGANPAGVVYSVNDGQSWAALAITGIGVSEVPTAIRQVGDYLVVFSKLGGGATLSGYYISPINTKTGVPSGTWTKITTGFVATFTINDVYVASPNEIFMVASGGYIYKSTDIASGVTVLNAANATVNALNRIHGSDSVLIAVGAAGTVLKSVTQGQTWANATASPEAASLGAAFVLDNNRYWVASPTRLYWTLDGGETWTEQAFSGSGTGTIKDVKFATDEIGWLAHTLSGAGRLFTAMAGAGDGWTNQKPRILNLGTMQAINRITVPEISNQAIRANTVMIAGLGLVADGAIYSGGVNAL